jgi:hypothetical protein
MTHLKYKRTFIRKDESLYRTHRRAYHRTWWFESFHDFGAALSFGLPGGRYRRP